MPSDFDPNSLFDNLPYETTVPSKCLNFRSLEYVCEGDAQQLAHFIRNTPFELNSPYFVIKFLDFENRQNLPFLDISIDLSIKYRGYVGGYPLITLETSQKSVYGGREKWGYPKIFANISYEHNTEDIISISASIASTKIVAIDWRREPHLSSLSHNIDRPIISPSYLIRCLPHIDREGIAYAEILRRNVGQTTTVKETIYGSGNIQTFDIPENAIRLGYAGIDSGLSSLKANKILSATMTYGDWYSTPDDGWATLAERLI